MATLTSLLPILGKGGVITHPLLGNDPVKMDSKGQLHQFIYIDGQYAGTSELKMNYFLLVSTDWSELKDYR